MYIYMKGGTVWGF